MSRIDTSQWKPNLQQAWKALPQDVKAKLEQEGPEKAIQWLEQKLSREIDLRGTVGAGKMTGRADKLRSPEASDVPQSKDPGLAQDLQRMMRNPAMFSSQAVAAERAHGHDHVHAHDHDHDHDYDYGGKHDHGHGAAGSSKKKADLSKVGKQKYDTDFLDADKYGETTGLSKGLHESWDLSKADHRKQISAQYDKQLDDAFGAGKWSFDPPITPANSKEALNAKHALLQMSGFAKVKSAEGDHVVNMDDGKHMITLRRDKDGHVTMTDHGKGEPKVPAASKFTSVADARKRFKDDFGVDIVAQGADGGGKPDKDFSKAELEKIHAGFKMMSPEEQKALKGTRLSRHTNIGKNVSADFTAKPSGYPKHKNKPPALSKEMRVADGMFEADKTRFVGNGKSGGSHFPSTRTALHEAGHALEFARLWERKHERNEAAFDFNQASGKKGTHRQAHSAWKSAQKGLNGDQKKALKDFNKATALVEKKITAFAKTPPDMSGKTKLALDAAIQQRDEALAKLPADHPARADAQTLSQAQDQHANRAHALAVANVKVSKAGKEGRKSSKSFQLMNFEKFVKDNKIPEFTDYSRTGKAEFYAEAYSLYRADPEWMKENSPLLFEFFENEQHLEDGWTSVSEQGIFGQSQPVSKLEELLGI